MSEHGTIVCEHPPEVNRVMTKAGGFKNARVYRYGKVLVTLLPEKEGNA